MSCKCMVTFQEADGNYDIFKQAMENNSYGFRSTCGSKCVAMRICQKYILSLLKGKGCGNEILESRTSF